MCTYSFGVCNRNAGFPARSEPDRQPDTDLRIHERPVRQVQVELVSPCLSGGLDVVVRREELEGVPRYGEGVLDGHRVQRIEVAELDLPKRWRGEYAGQQGPDRHAAKTEMEACMGWRVAEGTEAKQGGAVTLAPRHCYSEGDLILRADP